MEGGGWRKGTEAGEGEEQGGGEEQCAAAEVCGVGVEFAECAGGEEEGGEEGYRERGDQGFARGFGEARGGGVQCAREEGAGLGFGDPADGPGDGEHRNGDAGE